MSNSKMPKSVDFERLRPSGKAPVYIEQVELRGITVSQLKTLGELLFGEHELLAGCCRYENDQKTEELLTKDNINLYDLNYWVIKPMTKKRSAEEKDCSYVEAVCIARDLQKPTFLSAIGANQNFEFANHVISTCNVSATSTLSLSF